MGLESVKKVAEADFPTRWGAFRILGFEGVLAESQPGREPARTVEGLVALVMGDIHATPPLVRIHSQCLTGDVFGSLRCDCRLQLELALKQIAEAGAGILLYEQQEGRGIGLMAKLKAYELQDQGLDTVEANEELGFAADCRAYEMPAEALKLLGVKRVRLMTNNPEKVAATGVGGDRGDGAGVGRGRATGELRGLPQNQAGKDGPHLRGRKCNRRFRLNTLAPPAARFLENRAVTSDQLPNKQPARQPAFPGNTSLGLSSINSQRSGLRCGENVHPFASNVHPLLVRGRCTKLKDSSLV